MTAPVVPVNGYASVADYELRTGVDVPDVQEPMIQTRLNDVSSLVDVYLGDCADEVADAYPDVLTALVVANVWRVSVNPTGIRSESVGGTSVSYENTGTVPNLLPVDTDLLDTLMEGACGTAARSSGVGQIGVTLGGPTLAEEYDEGWVLAGPYRRWP